MAYVTERDMVERFGEGEIIDLTDRGDPRTHTIDADVLGRAIEDASSEINSYLGERYAVPVMPVPAALVRHACDITRFFLYSDKATEEVANRAAASRRWLRDLASGGATLMSDAGLPLARQTVSTPLAPTVGAKTLTFIGSAFDKSYDYQSAG